MKNKQDAHAGQKADETVPIDEVRAITKEYYDFVMDDWSRINELRAKVLKLMWKYTDEPMPGHVKQVLSDHGLLEN